MIKGINRHIIEITDPKPACFDRVLLFLHSDTDPKSPDFNKQTDSYLSLLAKSYYRNRRIKARVLYGAGLLGCFALGSATAYLLF